MQNKIGQNDYYLEKVERQIINKKLSLLDETFTFNESEFNFKYLDKLNKFLFRDFYSDDEVGLRKMNLLETKIIEFYLNEITRICISTPDDIEHILNIVYEIWHLQPFNNGNTRTMIAFLIIINHAFLLDLDINLNKEIKSGTDMFKLNNIVNQKRLTKNK